MAHVPLHARPSRRPRARARTVGTVGAAGIAALALLTGAASPGGAMTLPEETGKIPSGVKLSGVIEKGGTTNRTDTAAFGAWRGTPVTVVTDYLGGSSWSSIANTSWTGGRWQATRYHYVWSMFMLPQDGSGTLAQGATGAYDTYFRQAAQGLVANGFGASTIRLGWELTGSWEPWYAGANPAAFAAYWRHIVTAMRGVAGAHFTFDFNISDSAQDPTAAWPGDKFVDYVGGDFYDQSWASYGAANHAAVWNTIQSGAFGLDWLAKWAKSHRKRLSLPEWALVHRCDDSHGGEDDPYYTQQMHSWIASHDVAYETYFDGNDSTCHEYAIRTVDSTGAPIFPTAASAYAAAW